MTIRFEKLKKGLYRIVIPFENIYTSAYVLTVKSEAALVDSGISVNDAEDYIIPFVKNLGLTVKYIVSSHSHSDHIGGRKRLIKEYPKAECVDFFEANRWQDGDMLFDRFMLLNLKGHSLDGLVLYDIKTKTLLSGDSLQQYGIGKYRNGVQTRKEYLKDIERLRTLDIRTVIASHDYDPLGYLIEGKEKVSNMYDVCIKAI